MKPLKSFRVVCWTVFMLMVAPAFSGCAVLLLGGGAAGGYAISKDEIEGAVDARVNRVYRAALETSREKGIIKLQDEAHGVIEALVDNVNVKISLTQITEKAVRIRVKARKNLLPKIKIAQEIYTDIIKRIR